MYNCKYCNQGLDIPSKLAGHTTWCDLNPNKSKNVETCLLNNKLSNKEKDFHRCLYCNKDLLTSVHEFAAHVRICNTNIKFSNCKFCNQEFDSKKISGHVSYCELNPNKSKNLENLQKGRELRKSSLKDIRQFNCPWCKENFNVNANQFANHHRWCDLNPNRKRPKSPKDIGPKLPRKHSAETKKIISEKRKAYLAKNKGEHPWSRYSNSESEPEKNFRLFAEGTNIPLVQYYIPPESDRFFEMDFANLENKICFEINGNQHYLEDRKTLAPYYQERHDHFTSLGWKVLEIHYSFCFKESNIENILKESFIDFQKCEEKIQNIANSRIERKAKKLEKKSKESKKTKTGFSKKPLTQKEIDFAIKNRKVTRPTKEELYKMLWEMPTTKIALHFGVSDKCIEKWAKGYDISKPAPGYWTKVKSLKKMDS